MFSAQPPSRSLPRFRSACVPLAVAFLAITATAVRASDPAEILTTTPGAPRFMNYTSPSGVGDDSGEPSIGSNWTTEQSFTNSVRSIPNGGTVTYFGGFLPYMLKITFNDCQSPAKVTWDQKTLLTANTTRVYGDPILFTDHTTGRTFVTQEEGQTPAGSTTDITDNDGDTFSPSEGSGPPSCIDHETVGGGPFHAPLTSPLYPNAIYYASQCIGDAVCALSIDGGVTFGPSVPMFTIYDCTGLHGHIKVAPDGTVYVPNKACGGGVPLLFGGEASVVVSENNGVTWNIRTVPGQTSMGDDDPSVGVANDGSIYLGWQAADGHARIAVSHDKGLTWSHITDVGAMVGVQNCTFPAVVAGDGGVNTGRAAFAFYGTTTAGAYDQPEFPGVWYLYLATTYDGGATWTTQNLTPGDPIQRGGICSSGDCRNQLDFFDATIDKEGRILIGWDDGCVGGCVNGPPNSFTAKCVITRQSGGKRMFAAFDPVEPAKPEAPGLTGNKNGATVNLSWSAPDNGGADLTAYKLYRSVNAGIYTLVTTTTNLNYVDSVNPTDQLMYRLTAVNSQGEGPYCGDYVPDSGPVPTPCVLPGLQIVNDLNADGSDNDAAPNLPPDASVNVKSLSVAEPYVGPGVNQLVFTIQLGTNGTLTPSSQWYIVWNRHSIAADGSDRRFLAMKTSATGALSYVYGDFGPPLPLDGSIPAPNANTPTPLGNADFGSYDPVTGVAIIKLATNKADGTPLSPGSELATMNVRTYLARPDAGQKSQNNANDITVDGTYTLVGNASCFCYVNQPPVARLAASPLSGDVPLDVHFDASTSSDPNTADGDQVASYTFNFGDGSLPVTQSSPTITHTYTVASYPSSYQVTLSVTDQKCNEKSTNVASLTVQTTGNVSAVPEHPAGALRLVPRQNPAQGAMHFGLTLGHDGPVAVRVFSVTGKPVATLVNDSMKAGDHELTWSGRDQDGVDAPGGVYLVQVRAENRVLVSRVVLLP